MPCRAVTALLALTLAVPTAALADGAISIPFVAEIGGAPFSCGDTYPLGSGGTESGVLDFRLFVSNVVLVADDGEEVPVQLDEDGTWQTGNVALLDFEDGSGHCRSGTPQTNTTLRGHAPDGAYTTLRFDVGLPFAANHADPTSAPAPLNVTAMFWNWQGGHKFLKFEVSPAGPATTPMNDSSGGGHGDAPGDWYLHLGSTLCDALAPVVAPAQPCRNPNRVAISLDGFKLGASVVVVDPAPVLALTDVGINAPGTSPGCMSLPGDADCIAVMPRLGLPFDGAPAGAQMLVTSR